MEKLLTMARGINARFPCGNTPYQILSRLLEECGEVAREVHHFEDAGVKRQKYGEPSRESFANEIRQAMQALTQLVLYYALEEELASSVDASLSRMRAQGLVE